MSIADRIESGNPIGGRRVLAFVGKSRRGDVYRVECVGLPGRPCGFKSNVAEHDLLSGRALRCISCAYVLRNRAKHTPVGKEFAAARRRRDDQLSNGGTS
jgi:hypothetical protein